MIQLISSCAAIAAIITAVTAIAVALRASRHARNAEAISAFLQLDRNSRSLFLARNQDFIRMVSQYADEVSAYKGLERSKDENPYSYGDEHEA